MTRHTRTPKTAADSERMRRLRLIVALILATALVFVTVIAAIGFAQGAPEDQAPPIFGHSAPPAESGTTPRASGANAFATVAQTEDADRFAETAALAIFAWDTRDGYLPFDYVQSVLDQASDPGNEETDGLAQDLAGYLPNRAAWVELQRYETRQLLTIDSIDAPDAWADVERQARAGTLLPGTLAYTVEGVRHRAGVWDGERVTTEHPVSFTMFIACEPSYDQCRLLRLTMLDKPLT